MRLGGDRRGQSVWIGFLFLVLFLLIAATVYQASVVPGQIERVEADHAAETASDMHSVVQRVGRLGSRGGSLPVAVDLAPDYPPRLLAINPAPPSGSLHTVAAGNVTVSVGGAAVNLSRTCGYGGDETVPTRSLAYSIDYNRYRAGTLVYDHSVLYRERNGSHVLLTDEQSLIVGDTVNLAPLATPYHEGGTGTATVRLVGGPVGTRSLVAGANEAVRVAFPSDLPAEKWRELLAEQPHVRGVEQVSPARVAVVLEPGRSYTLTCYGVGLGQAPPSGVAPLGAAVAPVSTPAPVGDTAPNGTIEDVAVWWRKERGNVEAVVNVTWSATDPDGDLERVTVRATNDDDLNAESRTYYVEGSTASETVTFVFPSASRGDSFHVSLVVADDRENQEKETTTAG